MPNGIDDRRNQLPRGLYSYRLVIDKSWQFHVYIIGFLKDTWNTQLFIYGWYEHFLVGISIKKVGYELDRKQKRI